MLMLNEIKDDIYYVCTMIEFTARRTCNRRNDILEKLSDEDLGYEIRDAGVNHCLSFEQVSDEWIERYDIRYGDFDTISSCQYEIPPVTGIGRVYQMLILAEIKAGKDPVQAFRKVFSSFIIDMICNFNSSLYYSNPDYIRCCYEEGDILL